MEQEKRYAGFWIRVVAYIIDYVIINFTVYYCAVFFLSIAINKSLLKGISIMKMTIETTLMEMMIIEPSPSADIVTGMIGTEVKLGASIIVLATYVFFFRLLKNKGYTPGKKMVGIQIIHEDTHPLTYRTLLIREILGKFLSLAVLGIGYLTIAVHPEKKALHDIVAKTYVVYKRTV